MGICGGGSGVKKDIEWLKEQVAHEQNDGLYFRENYSQYDYFVNVEDLLPLIDQLDEPEVEEKIYTFENAKKWLQENGFVVFEKDKLDEEVQRMIDETYKAMSEKPVIPQFVADWIDTHNLYGSNPLKVYRDLDIDFNEGWTDDEDAAIYHWVDKNPYAFIDALRYGYEVEKDPKYYVLDKEGATLLKKSSVSEGVAKSVGTSIHSAKSWKDEKKYQLTEQEIKDYDERYIPFMVPVDEMEE